MITREAFDRLNFAPDDPFHGGWTLVEGSARFGGVNREILVTERCVSIG
jgi:hypothetical protein